MYRHEHPSKLATQRSKAVVAAMHTWQRPGALKPYTPYKKQLKEAEKHVHIHSINA